LIKGELEEVKIEEQVVEESLKDLLQEQNHNDVII
jgi:hypothetical protein